MAQSQDNVEKVDVTDALQLFKNGADTIYAAKSDLSGYVATETGKGLSSNDFSNSYKFKLDSVDTSTYLTTSVAANTYLTKSDASSTYVTIQSGKGLSSNDFTNSYKSKLDTLDNYTLPAATSSALGGVKIGSNISVNGGTISITKDNVTNALGYTPPTVNTTYSNASSTTDGLMSADDKIKLISIDDSAQVNVIESVKVNNTALTVTNKAVNINLANYTVKSAASLNSAQSLKVSLNSTAAQSFDGSSAATVIGVGGTLQPAYGGTGVTDLNNITVGGANRDGDGNIIKNFYVAKSDFKKLSNSVPVRFGYRIKKDESSPSNRVEYLYDAQGRTPAKMNFSSGVFDYGDWADVWFVNDNKPLMLKYNGSVDYYLDPNDYTKKADGSSSDVSNSNYAGNAMAQMPLCWFKRYEDNNYIYEIVSNVQWDDDYKAYAHIDANGNLKPYFYLGLFLGVNESSKCRSLKGKTLNEITFANAFSGAAANGAGWSLLSWSQFNYLRTLSVLLGKSTNSQDVFGQGTYYENKRTSGTLSDKGQFWGASNTNYHMKFLHVESVYEERCYFAGAINYNSSFYVKMTPEGDGYQYTNVNGYINTGITAFDAGGSFHIAFLKDITVNEYGFFPKSAGTTFYNFSTGSTQYYCDWLFLNSVNGIALVGTGWVVSDQITGQGFFSFNGRDVDNTGDTSTMIKLSYV